VQQILIDSWYAAPADVGRYLLPAPDLSTSLLLSIDGTGRWTDDGRPNVT